jgi:hypothetical protein
MAFVNHWTAYFTVTLVEFPAASLPVTLKLPTGDTYDVSIGCPFATVPMQLTMPDSESSQKSLASVT